MDVLNMGHTMLSALHSVHSHQFNEEVYAISLGFPSTMQMSSPWGSPLPQAESADNVGQHS
jgi:hypothetical protein